MQEHRVEFQRKHDLLPLLKLCVSQDKDFQDIKNDLVALDRYAVIVRYPGVRIEVKTAEAALKTAQRVRKFVRRKLGIK